MSKILLIGKNESFLHQCVKKLRMLDAKVVVHKDVLHTTRELFPYKVRCIVWDVQINDPNKSSKYKMLRQHYTSVPIIILDHHKADYEPVSDFDTIFLSKNIGLEQVVREIIDATSAATVLSDHERLKMLEKQFGFMDE